MRRVAARARARSAADDCRRLKLQLHSSRLAAARDAKELKALLNSNGTATAPSSSSSLDAADEAWFAARGVDVSGGLFVAGTSQGTTFTREVVGQRAVPGFVPLSLSLSLSAGTVLSSCLLFHSLTQRNLATLSFPFPC